MSTIVTGTAPCEVQTPIPETLADAVDPEWLGTVLAPVSGGDRIASVVQVELVKAMASKVRVEVRFEQTPEVAHTLCIKGFLDHDLGAGAGGVTTLREADFYLKIAPHVGMETPPCPVVVTERANNQCIFVMADMIAAGAHFYDALEPFTIDQVVETLEQLARLHAANRLVQQHVDWLPSRVQELADTGGHLTVEKMQSLMHDERRGELPDRTLDAELLMRGIKTLAKWNASTTQTLLHGDCHPGNVYRTREGRLGFTDWQLIHHGNWSLDVAYHIASVLPVEVAESEEYVLLRHYLEALRAHGGEHVSFDDAREAYSRAQIYGYYHWAITQRVHPPVTYQAFQRLGAAVTRHESYQRLGL